MSVTLKLKRRREEFFDWIWSKADERGLMGVDEGMVEAPRKYTFDQAGTHVFWREREGFKLYFRSKALAHQTLRVAKDRYPEVVVLEGPEEEPDANWNEVWQKLFKRIDVAPIWTIVIPSQSRGSPPDRTGLVIQPGTGFGTGTHETTQLCLRFIGEQKGLKGRRVLDFGCGSGILGIAAAKLGAEVDLVEIDPLAIENARQNIDLNKVTDRVEFVTLPSRHTYDFVVANILKEVLLQEKEKILSALKPSGMLVLCGLLAGDVTSIISAYGLGRKWRLESLGEWNALVSP